MPINNQPAQPSGRSGSDNSHRSKNAESGQRFRHASLKAKADQSEKHADSAQSSGSRKLVSKIVHDGRRARSDEGGKPTPQNAMQGIAALLSKIREAKDKDRSDASSESKKGPKSESDFRKKAKSSGWTVLEADDELPPTSKLDPIKANQSTITYAHDGKTYAVSNFVSPFKFTALENKLAGQEISRSDNNINIDVPESESTDFMYAKTTVDDKTVNELFNKKMTDA